MKIYEIKKEIDRLSDVYTIAKSHPEISAQIRVFIAANKPRTDELRELLHKKQTEKKTVKRWPDDIPEDLLCSCRDFWAGTEEFFKFKVNCWKNNLVWMTIPSGGYSNNMGWNKTRSKNRLYRIQKGSYYGNCFPLVEYRGGVSRKQMLADLETFSKEQK
ncbi:MAG: hypothetical protein M0R48_09900 [Candidatus Omnitrophica bacterium]|jgi:hypothetical protein|nr:hypothetical protein [Candidatus Omnitrophota bacterium]